MKLKLKELVCLKCGWKWRPRVADVRMCPNPKCRTAFWDTPKVLKNAADRE